MQLNSLVKVPLANLKLSEGFNQMANRNGFRNLEDVLFWPAGVLLLHPEFNYHIYQELRSFLKENNMVRLLKTVES